MVNNPQNGRSNIGWLWLRDEVIVVTGASRGLSRAMAGGLAADGAHPVLAATRRCEARLAGVVREIGATARRMIPADAAIPVALILLLIRETINAVDDLDIDKVTRAKIYSGNPERLLKLP